MSESTKKCPMCAEQVPLDAVICPYCATPFNGGTPIPLPLSQTPVPIPVKSVPAPRKAAWRWIVIFLTISLSTVLVVLGLVKNAVIQLPEFIYSLIPTLTSTITPTPTPDYTATQQFLEDQLATVTAQVAQSTLFEASRWTQVMFDSFDRNGYNWYMGTLNRECGINDLSLWNGRYTWIDTAKTGCVSYVWPNYQSLENFYLSVDCQQLSGAVDSACGVILRNQDEENFYYFSVSTDQYISFQVRQDDEWISLLNQKELAIQPWMLNRMIVVVMDSHFLFFVNGQYVAEMDDMRIESGKVGLMVDLKNMDDTATFEFDNFELRVP
jgi:hypothetical protein